MQKQALESVIVEGNAEDTVSMANQLGQDLSRILTTSQIRSIFGTVRRIEMNWPDEPRTEDEQKRARQAQRELVLLKPKMAYQAQRTQGRGVETLVRVLIDAIDLIGDDRQRFQHFVDFFEAILAYHKAYGGR